MLCCVLFVFELGYLWRAFNDEYFSHIESRGNKFNVITVQDTMYMLEGLSFLTLLCFHRKNFIQTQSERVDSKVSESRLVVTMTDENMNIMDFEDGD